MSIFRAIKKLGSASVKTALLPVDIALDSVGASLLRENPRPFTWDRLKNIGSDLSDAYTETLDE